MGACQVAGVGWGFFLAGEKENGQRQYREFENPHTLQVDRYRPTGDRVKLELMAKSVF